MLREFSAFSPEVNGKGDVKILRLSSDGMFPLGESAMALTLQACREDSDVRHLHLDFADVEWITSTELGALILLHKHLATRGGRLTLFNLREEIFEVFSVTQLHTFLEIVRIS